MAHPSQKPLTSSLSFFVFDLNYFVDVLIFYQSFLKDSFFSHPVTKAEIVRVVSRFKSDKSPGPDNIGPKKTSTNQYYLHLNFFVIVHPILQ